jgi:hypothetical protein
MDSMVTADRNGQEGAGMFREDERLDRKGQGVLGE